MLDLSPRVPLALAAALAALAALAVQACFPDDWNGEPYTGPGATDTGAALPGTGTGTGTGAPSLAGDWVSEGDDLAPLLAGPPLSYVRVEATFALDGTYVVTSVDGAGTEVPLSGTWSVGTDTEPATVALDQAEPYVARAEGIWEIRGGALTYEVVQVVPDYGFAPPTPEAGFGSTGGPGMSPGINTQRYQRR